MISDEIRSGHINIVNNEKLREIILEVLKDVASVSSTLGPGGRTNLLHDPDGATSLYPAKDGFRVVSGMHYDDYFYDAILRIIRESSIHNNTAIGDGTTSSIVILEKFFKTIDERIEETSNKSDYISLKHISKTGIVNILDSMKTVLRDILIEKGYIKFIDKLPVEKRMEIVTKVATIAANNDKTIGKYIAEIFRNCVEKGDDDLFVDISPNYSKDTDEASEIGFRLPCGYINRVFSTERDGRTAIYENPRFILFEGPLLDNDIDSIGPIIEFFCVKSDVPLVIFADEFSNKMAMYLYNLRVGAKYLDEKNNPRIMPPLKILPIQYHTGDDIGHERMMDLEVALGAKAISIRSQTWESFGTDIEYWNRICGGAEKIVCIPHDTAIIKGHGNHDLINGRIEKIKDDLNHMMFTDNPSVQLTVADYKERIGMLKSNMVVIKVGGTSFNERKYNCMVYEDAVYAVKSTIKNGYTLAGQVSICDAVVKYKDEIINKTVEIIKKEGRNVTFGKNREETLVNVIGIILDIINETFYHAYRIALKNAIITDSEVDEIMNKIKDKNNKTPIVYNLMTNEYETIDECKEMLVAGNTDYETYIAVISVVNIFLNCDNLETIFIPRLAK